VFNQLHRTHPDYRASRDDRRSEIRPDNLGTAGGWEDSPLRITEEMAPEPV
jgi:hypothetical protein